jgi:predicted PurR-regulated permease PerM
VDRGRFEFVSGSLVIAPLSAFLLFLLILVGIPALLGTVVTAQIRQDLRVTGEALEPWLSQPLYFLGYSLYPGALAALPSGSLNLLSGITAILLWAMLVLVSVYYFLKDGPRIKTGLAVILAT